MTETMKPHDLEDLALGWPKWRLRFGSAVVLLFVFEAVFLGRGVTPLTALGLAAGLFLLVSAATSISLLVTSAHHSTEDSSR